MTRSLFELSFDSTEAPWFLADPEPLIDAGSLLRGERVETARAVFFPIKRVGRPLDVTMPGRYSVVVTERIGSLIEELAPNDVQRIPARIGDRYERYDLLHVLARIDCIDWEHTPAHAYRKGDPHQQKGTLASLAPLIDQNKMYSHVMSRDMTLNTEGLQGPRIFRVVGWELWPIVTEDIKTALEHEHPSGLSYQRIQTSP